MVKPQTIVVASAMAGVTDLLEASLEAGGGEQQARDVVRRLRDQHLHALAHVAADDAAAKDAVEKLLGELERLVVGAAYTGEVSDKLRDNVMSFGERLAVQLLAAACRERGVATRPVDAAQAGIITDGPFGNARTSADISGSIAAAVKPITSSGKIPIITGFYGVDSEGRPTAFGRGGSDYVAALVATALDAEAVELWKDVPGFLTADPEAVTAARLVNEMDYQEAAELAYFGAKVLHPRCVEPVLEKGIPIRIRHLANPAATGTTIHAGAAKTTGLVRSAASRDRLAVVRLNGPGMGYTDGIARRVFSALATAKVNVLNMANSQSTFALLIDGKDGPAAEAALAALVGGSVRSVEILPNRSLVCVVGRGLGETPGSAAKILAAVSERDVNVEMISLGASEIAIDFIVPGEQAARALQGLHAAFLETP